jgi:pyruvate ferredoxin oxidoreductase alpha subunit
VLDRADSYGGYGPLYLEIASAMQPHRQGPVLFNKIYGLGGRDFMPKDVNIVLDEAIEVAKTGKVKLVKDYISVRN